MSINPGLLMPRVALVLPGDAMWGAFQTAFSIELAGQLEGLGYGAQPFDLTVGSSSGSLVATVAAAGTNIDHDLAHDSWVSFAQRTNRKRVVIQRALRGKFAPPHREAMAEIFSSGLIDTAAAFASRSTVVVSASYFDKHRTLESTGLSAAALLDSLRHLLNRHHSRGTAELSDRFVRLIETSAEIFSPRYFTSKSWRDHTEEQLPAQWNILRDKDEFLQAVMASSLVPYLYGKPEDVLGETLIDGVFSDNAPVELAFLFGATHVFVVNSSRKGNVFPRPVQSLIRRGLFKAIQTSPRLAERLPLEPAAPLDIKALEQRYPGQHIHVISPKKAPSVNRFFARPETVSHIYALGRQAAHDIRHLLPPPLHNFRSSHASNKSHRNTIDAA